MTNRAKLMLEDGSVYEGFGFGWRGEQCGELVFNTALCGYQEILTDPSYTGQIVTMTYPLIGNYGVNETDVESDRPKAAGFVVREYCNFPSNHRSTKTLNDYLDENKIPGIQELDTRAITKKIRGSGAMRCVISTQDLDNESLLAKAKNSPNMEGLDLVKVVTCREKYEWKGGVDEYHFGSDIAKAAALAKTVGKKNFKVSAIDYGLKLNILRYLTTAGCQVTVYPATVGAKEILNDKPDGVFLSNGPGDPAAVTYAHDCIRGLLKAEIPIFGICLGHQLLAHAFGGKTYKMKFGHRGGNQPVKNLKTGKIEITSQNHGFAVDQKSLNPDDVEVSYINLNDNTVEGLTHRKLPVFCVQFHPEASPGPHDAAHLFADFVELMAKCQR